MRTPKFVRGQRRISLMRVDGSDVGIERTAFLPLRYAHCDGLLVRFFVRVYDRADYYWRSLTDWYKSSHILLVCPANQESSKKLTKK